MNETAEVKIITGDDGVRVTGTGEMDLGIVKEFDAALAGAVESGQQITVDFLSADFIDSAILQSLLIHKRTLDTRNSRLKVVVAEGTYPQYVLNTVGFSVIMDIVAEAGKATTGK